MNETVRIGNLSITVDSIEYLQGIYAGLMLAMEAITNTDITNEAYKEVLHTMRYVDDLLNGIPKLKSEDKSDKLDKLPESVRERYKRMKKSVLFLKEALNAEHIMCHSINKYQSLYTENTRLYRLDQILIQLRMIIVDVKNNIEDNLYEFEASYNITNKENEQ